MSDPGELAAFLRAHRERLAPEDVGLRSSGRRRTPGLRREEVATLAGVSIDYLIRLEQGRDTRPSDQVVRALAEALRLTDDERIHLKILTHRGSDGDLCPGTRDEEPELRPTVLALLEGMAGPAFVLGRFGDVLAANAAWRALAGPLGLGPDANLPWFTFADPRARDLFPDWEEIADDHAASLRSAHIRWAPHPRLDELVTSLRAQPGFEERWAAHRVSEKRQGTKRLRHPDLGLLQVAFEVLLLPDFEDQRLVTWLPADDATATAFAGLGQTPLPAGPPRLRVVGEA